MPSSFFPRYRNMEDGAGVIRADICIIGKDARFSKAFFAFLLVHRQTGLMYVILYISVFSLLLRKDGSYS